jgi:hypothetical protein
VDEAEEYRFLCGADMAPEAVRAAYPGATFVARARLGEGEGAVWGILLRVPAGAADGPTRTVVTDDGRPFAAVAPSGGVPPGAPAAVLAEARYWELPPAYVARLAAAVGDGDNESG